MSESASKPRFIPPLCLYGGVALCVVITALLSFLYWPNPVNRPDGLILPTNRYYLRVVVVFYTPGRVGCEHGVRQRVFTLGHSVNHSCHQLLEQDSATAFQEGTERMGQVVRIGHVPGNTCVIGS